MFKEHFYLKVMPLCDIKLWTAGVEVIYEINLGRGQI